MEYTDLLINISMRFKLVNDSRIKDETNLNPIYEQYSNYEEMIKNFAIEEVTKTLESMTR